MVKLKKIEPDLKNISGLINNSYYLVSLRIHGLKKVDHNQFLIEINDLNTLREFNEKLCYRLEKFIFDYPFKHQHSIQEPDYIKSLEMVEHVSNLFERGNYNDLLKHLYVQLFAAIVLIENKKILWERLSIAPNRNLKWYLYTINLLYKNFQVLVLKIQGNFPEILNNTIYEKLSISEVKMKNLPKIVNLKIRS